MPWSRIVLTWAKARKTSGPGEDNFPFLRFEICELWTLPKSRTSESNGKTLWVFIINDT